jgi:hypothetical protein
MTSVPSKATPGVEGTLQKFFSSPPPMMHGEDAKIYAALYTEVKEEVQPKNILDQATVRDIADHIWHQMRYRRALGAIVNANRRKAVEHILVEVVGLRLGVAQKYADRYFDFNRADLGLSDSGIASRTSYDTKGSFDVAKLLIKHGLDESYIDQLALQISVDVSRKFEDIASWHELRREQIRLEIERRRKNCGPHSNRLTAEEVRVLPNNRRRMRAPVQGNQDGHGKADRRKSS